MTRAVSDGSLMKTGESFDVSKHHIKKLVTISECNEEEGGDHEREQTPSSPPPRLRSPPMHAVMSGDALETIEDRYDSR